MVTSIFSYGEVKTSKSVDMATSLTSRDYIQVEMRLLKVYAQPDKLSETLLNQCILWISMVVKEMQVKGLTCSNVAPSWIVYDMSVGNI